MRLQLDLSAEGALWLVFFAVTLACWWQIFAMITSDQMTDMAGALMQMDGRVMRMPDSPDFWPLCVMWAVMATAMMLPTFVPSLRAFLDLGHTAAATAGSAAALVAGYALVWVCAAIMGATVQLAMIRAHWVDGAGASLHTPLTAALLIVAGLYQFTRLKSVCLLKCQMPLTFFLQYWKPGMACAAGMGVRIGIVCLACCWAQMALAFVGGTMNLVWMGLATLFMTLEKLPAWGRWLTRPVGGVLVAAGTFTAIRPLIFT